MADGVWTGLRWGRPGYEIPLGPGRALRVVEPRDGVLVVEPA
jgi:hypothetical protein